jgi:transposase/transposase-like protein
LLAVGAGEAVSAVARRLEIAKSTLLEWLLRRKRERGEDTRPRTTASTISEAEFTIVRDLATQESDSSLSRLCELFTSRTGRVPSRSAMARALAATGIQKVRQQRAAADTDSSKQGGPRRYRPEHRRAWRQVYASSVTDKEWAVIQPLLGRTDARGRPKRHATRTMLDAVMYVLRTGCQWRALPKDFPPFPAVWSTFRRWRDSGLLERVYAALLELWRTRSGRGAVPSAAVIDSQTVKTTEKGGSAATTAARRRRGGSVTSSSTSRVRRSR